MTPRQKARARNEEALDASEKEADDNLSKLIRRANGSGLKLTVSHHRKAQLAIQSIVNENLD